MSCEKDLDSALDTNVKKMVAELMLCTRMQRRLWLLEQNETLFGKCA